MRFIKRLFGSDKEEDAPRRAAAPVFGKADRANSASVSDAYFDTMARLQSAISNRDFVSAGEYIRTNLTYIPEWVRETRQQFGSFDIGTIPALQQGGTILALLDDGDGIDQMEAIVRAEPDLARWQNEIEHHRSDRILFRKIEAAIANHAGCLQKQVKELVGASDGHRVATLIGYLEKAGRIARIKEERTYRLVLPGSASAPTPPPKRIVQSHRVDRTPQQLHEIDIAALDYIPLPRSPLKWEEARSGASKGAIPEAADHFEVRDADWRIGHVEAIPPEERPDPAFRQMHPTSSGIIIVDDLGNAEGLGQIEAAALRFDRAGTLVAKKALLHDVYRVGVHPLGHALVALSKDATLHAYDDTLSSMLETPLADAPEMRSARKRFGISDDQLKNHIRCVALSRSADRYLFTVVDEAWCVGSDGLGLWGAKLPLKDGWTRVSTPSGGFGTSEEVDQALRLMSLALPVTPDDLKRRYRELAKKWHPDLNPGDPTATGQMKALSAAAEVLTGIDTSAMPQYVGATFMHEMASAAISIGGQDVTATMGIHGSESFAADWIYAASFAGHDDGAYLAGYSGRVVRVDGNGRGIRVYDIGSVPRRIIDTGDFLYLLTDTRLYVLRDNALLALVDTHEGGDLVMAETGFCLTEKKRLRWFREDGRYLGSIVTKDPIRRIYAKDESTVVETRQRRATIQGMPSWWE